jgi:hypothetical protein
MDSSSPSSSLSPFPSPSLSPSLSQPSSLVRKTLFYSHPSDPVESAIPYPDQVHLTFFDKERGFVRKANLLALIPTLDETKITMRSVIIETLQNTGGTYVAELYRLPVY